MAPANCCVGIGGEPSRICEGSFRSIKSKPGTYSTSFSRGGEATMAQLILKLNSYHLNIKNERTILVLSHSRFDRVIYLVFIVYLRDDLRFKETAPTNTKYSEIQGQLLQLHQYWKEVICPPLLMIWLGFLHYYFESTSWVVGNSNHLC